CRDYQCVPVQHLSSDPKGDPTGGRKEIGGRRGAVSNETATNPNLSRRDVLSTAAVAAGALVVGVWMPPRATAQIIHPEGAAWAEVPAADEVNAWVVVAPDETV